MESDVKDGLKTEGTWRVDEEDEARYNFSDEKGLWQPKPEDILSMFDKLSKGGALPLEWTCPGRRAPESEQDVTKKEEMEMEVDKEESREEESREPEPCAFDFDDTQSESGMMKTTPMRALGGPGRTPRTEKRVARMDNIMDSLLKQQIQRAAEREARRAKASPGRTPPGRGRLLKFGSPLAQSPKSGGGPEQKKVAPVMAIGQISTSASVTQASSPAVPTSSDSSSSSLQVQSTTPVAPFPSNTSTNIPDSINKLPKLSGFENKSQFNGPKTPSANSTPSIGASNAYNNEMLDPTLSTSEDTKISQAITTSSISLNNPSYPSLVSNSNSNPSGNAATTSNASVSSSSITTSAISSTAVSTPRPIPSKPTLNVLPTVSTSAHPTNPTLQPTANLENNSKPSTPTSNSGQSSTSAPTSTNNSLSQVTTNPTSTAAHVETSSSKDSNIVISSSTSVSKPTTESPVSSRPLPPQTSNDKQKTESTLAASDTHPGSESKDPTKDSS